MLKTLIFAINVITVCILNFSSVSGHGMLLDPVARGSRWRFNSSAPVNYNDNEGFCGGFREHWKVNKGRCGLCGDNFADKAPRSHELHGKFGEGVITKRYAAGSVIHIGVQITANHKGYFKFDLCDLNKRRAETEECFQAHPLRVDRGKNKFALPNDRTGWFNTTLQLPKGLQCRHCVLRWTYVAGNSWNMCNNTTGALGCGTQEHFVGCSDISILEGIPRQVINYDNYNYYSEEDNEVQIEDAAPIFDLEDVCYNLYAEKLKERICK